MARSYLPLLLLFGVSLATAIMMVMMSHMMGPQRPTPQKEMPYESGMIPLGDSRQRFTVKFYLVGILFIVFDIETIFLIPWSVSYRDLGVLGFIEGLVFVAVLGVGLLYVWRKGGLDWE